MITQRVATLAQRKAAEASRRRTAAARMEVDLAELGMRLGGSFILFGSYVLGEMRFDSDLDLLIDMPADVVAQAFAEAEAMGRHHDLPLDLHDAATASPDFVTRVRRNGRVALGAPSK